jgi:hypothetical protein
MWIGGQWIWTSSAFNDVNIVSIQLLLWQAATAWFMEASYVSSRSESRGLPKRADSMDYGDKYEPNSVDAFVQNPSTVVPLWRHRRASWWLGQRRSPRTWACLGWRSTSARAITDWSPARRFAHDRWKCVGERGLQSRGVRGFHVQKDNDREREPRGVAGRAAVAYLKESQAMMKIVLIYMLGFLVVVAIVLFLWVCP